MFELASNSEIGIYLEHLIKKKYQETGDIKYKNVRQFCKACLEAEGIEPTEDELRKKTGHMSGMKNEEKPIRLTDLPIFTRLLNVSCEEILSAGETKTATANHLTNYQIASSHDKNLWEFSINSEDSIFLNPDEYDKTILDYAFEFKNYGLLKYLVDKKYIWFVPKEPGERCGVGFCGGTSIKRRPLGSSKIMEAQLTENDSLRRKMIVLAIENNDIDMLDEFRAREIPLMYYKLRGAKLSVYYDEDLIEAASRADQSVLDYFSETITIKPTQGQSPFQCMYPFIGEMIEKLIEHNNPYADTVLKKCIEHNKNTFEKANELKCRKYGEGKNAYSMFRLHFYQDNNVIEAYDVKQNDFIVTNIIRMNTDLNSELIKELNSYYDKILDMAREEGNYVF